MLQRCDICLSGLIVIITLSIWCCSSEVSIKPQSPDDNSPHSVLFKSVPSSQSGLSFRNDVKQTLRNNHMVNVKFICGGGVAIGDINNDNLPDLFFTSNQGMDKLYLNEGGLTFKDISSDAGIIDDTLWSAGVTFVDIDQDGDDDIYVCRNVYLEDHLSANHLYINNGDLTFTESAAQYGLNDRGFSVQATFFDYNKDNLIDMYLVNQPPSLPGKRGQLNMSMAANALFSDKLFLNTGEGFKDVTEQAKLRNFAFGLSATVGDFNNDSWPDIYVTNDFDVPDHLYINQKDGTFKNEIWDAMKHISNFSMGSDVADYDNDGNLDIVVVDMVAEEHQRIKSHMGSMAPEAFWQQVRTGGHYQYMFNTLQRNNGNGTFSELAQLAKVTNTDWSWAPLLADFDNDGFKDLFISNGVLSNNRMSDLTDLYQLKLDSIGDVARRKGLRAQDMIDVLAFAKLAPCDSLHNYIFKNNGDYSFENKVVDWGLSKRTLSNGAAYADLDLDGDLDLVINNINDEALLYENTIAQVGENNFIRFRLEPKQSIQLYGTRVKLFRGDTLWQMVELSNARGFMGKSENTVHFGVGPDDFIEQVAIEWTNNEQTLLADLATNNIYDIRQDEQENTVRKNSRKADQATFFFPVEKDLMLTEARHIENNYDDYAREVLLPHKMSQFGPTVAIGDVNDDGREDFYLGGAAGYPGALYIQLPSGVFAPVANGPWHEDRGCEDMGSVFVDVNGDSKPDLFVVSGGNEFSPMSPQLQDRLYINQGEGKFMKAVDEMPKYLASGSCVNAVDYDNDGDLDLFVGGRLIPGKYPHPANSFLLENQAGALHDVTAQKAPELKELGMVTDASWTDYNNDGRIDLVVVGEWMPITIFVQSETGIFRDTVFPDLAGSGGWYYSVATEDMDGDGDQDIVAGNLGLNYKFKASSSEPFEVYSDDFDDNGQLDIVLSYYEHGEIFPVRGKDCSTQQIPSFEQRFETYAEFASLNLKEVYGPSLENAFHLQAHNFASVYVENLGDDKFDVKELPSLAQVSSINAIQIMDLNHDQQKDIIICGNLYQSEIETPRNDAGYGLVLLGDGKGSFTPLSVSESGFFAPNDAKDLGVIRVAGNDVFLIVNNDDRLQALQLRREPFN